MALLTPKDIREHTFRTVRLKEGYDVDEVDDFLDQVTETVEALGRQAMQGSQSTQSLGPDVASLNTKISELTAQVQSLQEENEGLKTAAANAGAQSAQVDAAQLTEAQESNRALTIAEEYEKAGIEVDISQDDIMRIRGGQIRGCCVDSHGDHRIAMSMAVAALTADSPITIRGAECVAKSYPSFFEDLAELIC